MMIEVSDDMASSFILSSLSEHMVTMEEQLADYDNGGHGWIAAFSTDEEEDKDMLRKAIHAYEVVIAMNSVRYPVGYEILLSNETYKDLIGSTTRELETNILRENPDGSAVMEFDFTAAERASFERLGIMTAIKAGLKEAEQYHPEKEVEE